MIHVLAPFKNFVVAASTELLVVVGPWVAGDHGSGEDLAREEVTENELE
jgi:hypothetical protein